MHSWAEQEAVTWAQCGTSSNLILLLFFTCFSFTDTKLNFRYLPAELMQDLNQNTFVENAIKSQPVCKNSPDSHLWLQCTAQKVEIRGFLFLCFMTSRFGMSHLPAAYAWITLSEREEPTSTAISWYIQHAKSQFELENNTIDLCLEVKIFGGKKKTLRIAKM